MNRDDLHSLTAAYALDALSPFEARAFEDHLPWCEACRAEVADLQGAAAVLGYALAAPSPPAALRGRILESARRERRSRAPLGRRAVFVPTLAAALACVALGLGALSLSLAQERDRERQARIERDRAVLVLVQPDAHRLPLGGGRGTLVRGSAGDSALVLARLEPAGPGRVYEAWVVERGQPRPAGTFEAGPAATVHALTLPVPPGAFVTVTLEPRGGSSVPTGSPLLRSAPA